MPLDALPAPGFSRRHLPPAVPSLDQAERNAAVHFAPLLRQQLANQPTTDHALILMVKMTADLKDTAVRLIEAGAEAGALTAGETALAWVVQGVPPSEAKRRALAVRLASAAAVAWRQHCQIQRLGFLNA
ncbi:hypothetical protein E2C06_09755 [Dankookia rubra]|uniref:Uncharacterized protein n=1 Tax=Dankookia rubra TaxID=1442381 RepID=A0A4R5QH85_9PROT|nr:hypothetical protein [Dankookia rubra]TDH62682.1 hypothetical protein E2C06_09755 [Dankookia rubra]